jgi:transposase InsO family protein
MKLTGIDQLWVADITYIRLKAEFVYLAVILDGFSRKVVGWALDRTLASRLAMAALEQATAKRRPPAALVHQSLGPRSAIRLRRTRGPARAAPNDSEHESSGEPV